jgi:hypothetical protein
MVQQAQGPLSDTSAAAGSPAAGGSPQAAPAHGSRVAAGHSRAVARRSPADRRAAAGSGPAAARDGLQQARRADTAGQVMLADTHGTTQHAAQYGATQQLPSSDGAARTSSLDHLHARGLCGRRGAAGSAALVPHVQLLRQVTAPRPAEPKQRDFQAMRLGMASACRATLARMLQTRPHTPACAASACRSTR